MAHKLDFEYKNVKKEVFIDRYKRSNVIKDCQKFLKIIKTLKPYLIKFKNNKFIKTRNYSNNCAVGGNIY